MLCPGVCTCWLGEVANAGSPACFSNTLQKYDGVRARLILIAGFCRLFRVIEYLSFYFYCSKIWEISKYFVSLQCEKGIWQMADGYSQVYGNSIVAVNNLCRHEGSINSLYGGNLLICAVDSRVVCDI